MPAFFSCSVLALNPDRPETMSGSHLQTVVVVGVHCLHLRALKVFYAEISVKQSQYKSGVAQRVPGS
jgi:hypothetical protein